SLGGIVTYAKGASVVREMAPLDELDGLRLGNEVDYAGRVTRDLVKGVEASVGMLRKVTTPRKVLVVVGDGADTNIDNAKQQLAKLAKLCEQDRIELHAINYTANIGDELTAIKSLTPHVQIAATPADVSEQARELATRLGNRYQISFPGQDPS